MKENVEIVQFLLSCEKIDVNLLHIFSKNKFNYVSN